VKNLLPLGLLSSLLRLKYKKKKRKKKRKHKEETKEEEQQHEVTIYHHLYCDKTFLKQKKKKQTIL